MSEEKLYRCSKCGETWNYHYCKVCAEFIDQSELNRMKKEIKESNEK